MTRKRTMSSKKGLSDEELLAQLQELGTQQPPSKPPKPSTSTAASARQSKQTSVSGQTEQDLLDDLQNLATQRPPSRPSTPSLKPSSTSAGNRSPKRTSTATSPPPIGGRLSEDKASSVSAAAAAQRRSGDSMRSFHQSQTFTPATTTTEESPEPEFEPAPATPAASSGGGWWGGLLSTATAAVSQAQAAVKEIQRNEEAQRWAEQVRGNVGALRGLGGELRSIAMPTFQNILQTIAPPISSHERLQIHITHDLSGYPTLDPLIYAVFSRVMSQVEGGDLMVIQRGQEASPRHDSDPSKSKTTTSLGGWHDGPWWRAADRNRSVNAVHGAVEGSKLARASAESYASEFFATRGGVEQAAKRMAQETLSDTNPTRNSDIFLAIQAITQLAAAELFQGGAASTEKPAAEVETDNDEAKKEETAFAIYLHDPVHGIAFHTVSQWVPSQWVAWLDAKASTSDSQTQTGSADVGDDPLAALPPAIAEIIDAGGVDPREWVAEWIEETLNLAVGVVAQRYVARRMGIGEVGGPKGRGNGASDVLLRPDRGAEGMVESGGGEAARAIGGM